MVLHTVSLEFTDRLRLRGLSDPHIGAEASEEKRLKRDVTTILKEPDSYVILMGDQMEAITNKDPRFSAGSINKGMISNLGSLMNEQLAEAVDTFQPLADSGQLIGALIGNHEIAFNKHSGIDIHRLFCEQLDIKNLGYSCILRMTIRGKSGPARNVIVKCHHGHGGSGHYTGASINAMERDIGRFRCDISFMGHNHKRHVSTSTVLDVTSNGKMRLIERDIVCVRTGGYYKTYEEGTSPSYGEVAGYAPVKIGEPPYVDITMEGQHYDLKMRTTQ